MNQQKIKYSVLTAGVMLLMASFVITPDITIDYPVEELRRLYSSGDASRWPAPLLDSTVSDNFRDIGVLPAVVHPENNPYSDARRDLGKILFFDPRLSASGQIACASCHDSELGWGDGRRVSFGHNRATGKRNAMTLLNVGYYQTLFWDGRAASLEDQAHFPLEDTLEMHSHRDLAIQVIRRIPGYRPLFKSAYGDTVINFRRVEMAIATFERTIVSGTSRFDQFIQGKANVFTDDEVQGLHLFRTKARCLNCHNTPLFSDNQFHNTGLTYYGRPFEDLGRYHVTGMPADVGKFRTPSLREFSLTGPYMHNGLFTDVDGLVNLYNAGMPHPERKASQQADPLFPVTSTLLIPLQLTAAEKKALVAFLGTLSSPPRRQTPPALPL